MSNTNDISNAFPGHDLDAYLQLGKQCATEAGKLIRAAFYDNNRSSVQYKSEIDLVTETDKQSEALVLGMIRKQYPDHKFIGEESANEEVLTDDPTWIVDPIDGTTNFVHRYPFVAVSIGLAINKQLVVGVVFNPILNEMFTAIKGRGAFLNDQPIQCSATEELKKSLVATGFTSQRTDEKLDVELRVLRTVLSNVRDVRRDGSAALDICSVAMGRLDMYYEQGPHIWDIAAGLVVLYEAGGMAADPFGGEFSYTLGRVLVGNKTLVPKFLAAVNEHKKKQ